MRKFSKIFIKILHSALVERVLISLAIKSAGFQAWIVRLVMEKIVLERILEPSMDALLREMDFIISKRKNNLILKRVIDAKTDTDRDRAIDDLLG